MRGSKAVPGVGETNSLIEERSQKGEPTQEEKELLKRYGPTLGFTVQNWGRRCPKTPFRDTYFTLVYGSSLEKPERNNHFEDDLKRAQGLGWVIIDTSDRGIDVVVLTGRGEYLAEPYV